jgi:hypothetical protein
MSGYELDRDLPYQSVEEALGEVIEEPGVADAAAELKSLKLASGKKSWIEEGRYRDAAEALDKDGASVAELNDLGCALAWLAFTERRVDYWDEAITKLEDSKKWADGKKSATDQEKERATFNVERVKAARETARA